MPNPTLYASRVLETVSYSFILYFWLNLKLSSRNWRQYWCQWKFYVNIEATTTWVYSYQMPINREVIPEIQIRRENQIDTRYCMHRQYYLFNIYGTLAIKHLISCLKRFMHKAIVLVLHMINEPEASNPPWSLEKNILREHSIFQIQTREWYWGITLDISWSSLSSCNGTKRTNLHRPDSDW